MGHAYIPGLKVARWAVVRKKRILPIQGDVLVKEGDAVQAHTVVARASLPGRVHVVNVVNQLGISPDEIRRYMTKKEGDPVEQDEVIAETRPFIKLFKSVSKSPIKGFIDSVSEVTGQVLLREPPQPLDLAAYLDGTVVEVIPREGVVVETRGVFVQGIFGLGGERTGEIEIVEDFNFKPEHKGKVAVGRELVSAEALKRGRDVGVAAIVAGGINDRDVRDLLGYDIGVAITGTEAIGFTLIITEGFGRISMAKRTFDLLSENRGKKASVCGATQIRAGVIRPEIIVSRGVRPIAEAGRDDAAERGKEQSQALRTEVTGSALPEGGAGDLTRSEGMRVGDLVRVIREPYFGRIGRVVDLPPELQELATESKARVVKLDLGNGAAVTIPRTNVEILEE